MAVNPTDRRNNPSLSALASLVQAWSAAGLTTVITTVNTWIASKILRTDLETLPNCRVRNTADLASTTGVGKTLTWNTDVYDVGSMHDTSSNTERLIATKAGRYRIGASVRFAANATGQREVYIYHNGTTVLSYTRVGATAAGETVIPVYTEADFALNDYVIIITLQNSGGNLDITAGLGNTWATMSMMGNQTS